jgi:recombination protein U
MGYWNTRGLRGSALEDLINLTNSLYMQRGLAVVQKIATPITPIEVDNRNHTISKAYFDTKSTVDYIGAAQGIPICFDAKDTTRTSLPIQNIHSHQIEFMERFQQQQGVCFLLVRFAKDGSVFFLPFDELNKYWREAARGGRKSIPFDGFNKAFQVENSHGFPLHYLEALKAYLERLR